MEITIKKLTDDNLMRRACEMTMHGKKSNMTLEKMYKCEHSPMRTQMFWIEMLGIPTFASVHFVRHKIGVEHFVTTNRDDRGGESKVDRLTPVNHGMLINAQALVNLARKRLCSEAHKEVQYIMGKIVEYMYLLDADLAERMVPDCEYRNGCYSLRGCGYFEALNE